MKDELLISVVLPVYNGEEYIRAAINSVLNQTFRNFELIIINDGSKDDSLKIIKEFDDSRIILIDQENKGLAKTLNVGIHAAKGKYIARMDADDIALSNRFQKQIEYLTKYPNIKLLGTAVELIDVNGKPVCIDIPFTGSRFLKWYMRNKGNPFKHPTVLFDRITAIEVGGYNETIGKFFEDYFLWSKISHCGKIEITNDVLLQYRITPGSIMSSVKSPKFSNFMINVVNKGTFDEADLKMMVEIKAQDELQSGNTEQIYNKRIEGARNNRMNILFLRLNKLFGYSVSIRLISILKKINAILG